MNGKELTTIVDAELNKRGISKMDFYEATGVSSATYSQWKNGTYEPSYPKIQAIENYLGIQLQGPLYDSDMQELHEMLRDRPDLRTLLRSAAEIPPSSVYSAVSFIEKVKESST